jgi:hypothetical protein
VVALPFETVFEGSDGRYYTDWQVRRRLRDGEWTVCMYQRAPHRRLVEIADNALLMLTPTDPDELPDGLEIRVIERRARVVDTRRVPPR